MCGEDGLTVEPGAQRKWDAPAALVTVAVTGEGVADGERGVAGTGGMVFLVERQAKPGHEAALVDALDDAAVAFDLAAGERQQIVDDRPQGGRAQARGEQRQVGEAGAEHGGGLALGDEGG